MSGHDLDSADHRERLNMTQQLQDAAVCLLMHSTILVEENEQGSHLATGVVTVPLDDVVQLAHAVRVGYRPDLGPGMRIVNGELRYSASWL